MTSQPVFRFAPSPNGLLHLGHAYSALVTYRAAQAVGGRFLLRIEDIDVGRCREAHVDQIYEDLTWLGLRWEEPVLRQSSQFSRYAAAADTLRDLGLLYPCFASRRDILGAVGETAHACDPDGAPLYPGLHKGLDAEEVARRKAAGDAFALRLDMQRALSAMSLMLGGAPLTYQALSNEGTISRIVADPVRWGDAVVVRKDTPASYHLSVVLDDAFQGVTHVTRGQDLEASTDIHRMLQVLLDLPEPVYLHHRLLLAADGRKLSKSAGDTALSALRAQGWTADDVLSACFDPAQGFLGDA